MDNSQRHRVLIVEDDEATRERFRRLVQSHPSLESCGEAGTLAEARAALDESEPDVLLVDLGLPDGSGIELIRETRDRGYDTEIMVITVFGDERHVVAAIEAGATGYLLKDSAPESVGDAILELVGGGSPISPGIARHLLARFQKPEPAIGVPRLTEREHEVLVTLVKGFTYGEIAKLLAISPHTVTSHVKHIYRKLEVQSRAEAVYEAIQLGLIGRDV